MVEEPHAFLGGGEGDPPRPRTRSQRRPGGGAALRRGHHPGERARGGGVEQCADADVGVQHRVDAGHRPGGTEGVTAVLEEAVVDPETGHLEYRSEQPGERVFERSGGDCPPGTVTPVPSGSTAQGPQCVAVEFARRGARYLGNRHYRCGNHVRGQSLSKERDEAPCLEILIGGGQYVGGEGCVTRSRLVSERRCEGDGGMAGQHRIDLTQFDAETADLHLEIAAAQILQRMTVVAPPDDVTGTVQPLARAVGVCHEPGRGEAAAPVVATCQPAAGNIELAGRAHRDRLQPGVEHELGDAANRAADRDRLPRDQVVGEVGGHRRLGRAVRIEHAVFRRPASDQLRRAFLATGKDAFEPVESGRIERGQGGGSEEGMGHAAVEHPPLQLLAAVHGGGDQNHRGSRRPGQQVLQNRCVEARGREVHDARSRRHVGALAQFVCQRVDPTMAEHDTFRDTGRPGGVNEVGRGVDART